MIWAGPEPSGVVFTYAPGRSGNDASQILQGFEGVLQIDGYAGYNRVLDPRDNAPIQLAYCWAHARRKLYELTENNVAPIAEAGLKQIATLYRIESKARGLPAEERHAMRQEKSAPKVAAFKTWLDQAAHPNLLQPPLPCVFGSRDPVWRFKMTMSLTNLTETWKGVAADWCVFPSSTNPTTRSRSSIGCGLPICDLHICPKAGNHRTSNLGILIPVRMDVF
jgi:hypothetical protein